ncbi:MAG TPA: GNAT family N-acetyltransferase [Gemmatimonadales bacterium]|nr:GNAT family N-acetyltransferase [Gemmatimonadales bacterium]
MPPTLTTPRLVLRELTPADAPFIRVLLNDPDFIRFIADRGVRSVDDAVRYIDQGPRAMYARHGMGLMLVEVQEGGVPVGICGLLRRDGLDDPDLGFAFLPEHRRKGYAAEAAGATLAWGRDAMGLQRILAITSLDNEASGRLLGKLGFRFERIVTLPGDPEELRLYATG